MWAADPSVWLTATAQQNSHVSTTGAWIRVAVLAESVLTASPSTTCPSATVLRTIQATRLSPATLTDLVTHNNALLRLKYKIANSPPLPPPLSTSFALID